MYGSDFNRLFSYLGIVTNQVSKKKQNMKLIPVQDGSARCHTSKNV